MVGVAYCNPLLTVKSDLTSKVISLTVDEALIKKYRILYGCNVAGKRVVLVTLSYRFMLNRTYVCLGL